MVAISGMGINGMKLTKALATLVDADAAAIRLSMESRPHRYRVGTVGVAVRGLLSLTIIAFVMSVGAWMSPLAVCWSGAKALTDARASNGGVGPTWSVREFFQCLSLPAYRRSEMIASAEDYRFNLLQRQESEKSRPPSYQHH
jgi:hypothetical protein